MREKLGALALGRDIRRFGGASFVAVALGVVQVFVIPRRVDIATYGEYRLFLLYSGYLGLLHFGMADGAFLRWAGRPARVIRDEWPRAARWLAAMHCALLVIGIVGSVMATRPLAKTLFVAFAACAFAANMATLAGYALQAAGDFRGASYVTVLTSSVFVAAVLMLPLHSLRFLLAASIASTAIAAVVGAAFVSRIERGGPPVPADSPLEFRALVRNGVPVLGANLAAGVSQFADRILVSLSVPVRTFALYGFASTAMVAVSVATQSLLRVALSHAAHRASHTGERARFLGGFYYLIAAAFGAALAGLPLFEHLVARWLPDYVPALPIVRALVLAAPFWIPIHVVLVGTLQSHGFVRWQLGVELTGLTLVVIACEACLVRHTPLWEVAAAATAAAAVTWIVGVSWVNRLVPAAREQPSLRFAVLVTLQSVALIAALAATGNWIGRSLIYAALAAVPTLIATRAARAHDWR